MCPDTSLENARVWCEDVNAVLAAHAERGFAMSRKLDAVHHAFLEHKDAARGLRELRDAWIFMQPDLEFFQAQHEGALEFFVRIKDQIKKMMEKQKGQEQPRP